jgi:hypothetical protein
MSPHPGVVLVVEGETEELLVPRIAEVLQFDDELALVSTTVMRGTKQNLVRLVGFVASPIVERYEGDSWLLRRPPTEVHVALDPDDPYRSPAEVEKQRQLMLDEIVKVLEAQGVDVDRAEIDHLVRIRTWRAPCFEFAHFTDAELAAALTAVHPTIGGLSPERLESAIARHRAAGGDVGRVFDKWRPAVSKPRLAEELWPVLRSKIEAAMTDDSVDAPEVAEVVAEAFQEAARRRHPAHWVLRGKTREGDTT